MKINKFLLFALLPLTCFSVIEIFLLPFRAAYSRENNISKEKKENFTCEKYYKLHSNEKKGDSNQKEVDSNKQVSYPEAQDYCHALTNTKIATYKKIWRNLTVIDENNTKLSWENKNDKVNRRVLVISWKDPKSYKDKEGQIITSQRDVWVTVVPELHDFCKKYNRHEEIRLPYRLNQVLGLAPETNDDYQKRKLVEIWVKPKDLFRPTPDPEITDREAELYFPQSYSQYLFVSHKYKLWFLNQLMTNNYPWTKLGYTYDWGNKDDWDGIDPKIPKRPANVGLSEFIIRKDAPIKIKAIHKAKDYCKKKHTVSS